MSTIWQLEERLHYFAVYTEEAKRGRLPTSTHSLYRLAWPFQCDVVPRMAAS
jgi:hypothetical protein